MGVLKVTSEQLNDLSGQVSKSSDQIQSELKGLANQLAPLQTDWEGSASQAFQSLWDQWQQSTAGLQNALSGISQLLGNASQAYAEAEQQVTSTMKG